MACEGNRAERWRAKRKMNLISRGTSTHSGITSSTLSRGALLKAQISGQISMLFDVIDVESAAALRLIETRDQQQLFRSVLLQFSFSK